VADAADANRVYWSIDSSGNPFDAKGNLLRQRFGDPNNPAGVQTFHDFDRATGMVKQLAVGIASGVHGIQQLSFQRDLASQIRARTEATTGLTETFGYDPLGRLTDHSLNLPAGGTRSVQVHYNALGNILWKSDVGSYLYPASGSTRPHAVQSAGGSDYSYDANGNITQARVGGVVTRNHTWTSFDLPAVMSYGSREMSWRYSAENQRVEHTVRDGATIRRTVMLHPDNAGGLSYEREDKTVAGAIQSVENRHYIAAIGGVVAVVKTYGAGNGSAPATSVGTPAEVARQTVYWHKDHLGSVVAVTDARGVLIERMAFDAWGARMRPDGTADPGNTLNPSHGDRGFTGHEHLDELGLIHMNGRVYDPRLARFLSADPVIQAPEALQNHNRYSYVFNNPVNATDPTGQVVEWVALWVASAMLASEGNKHWRIVGQIGMFVSGYQISVATIQPGLSNAADAALQTKILSAGASGFAGGFVASGGDLAVAFQEGVFAAVTAGVGNTLTGVQLVLAHAAIGCARGAVSGGSCGPSAMAAFAAKVMTLGIETWDLPAPAELAASMIAGGTASVIGGGKFSSGAAQAAFGYLFNQNTGGKPSPALTGDPYHPDASSFSGNRALPPYESHDHHGKELRQGKTIEPSNAAEVYKHRAVRVDMKTWIALAPDGTYYRYQFDATTGKSHFSAIETKANLQKYGYGKMIGTIDRVAALHHVRVLNAPAPPGATWRTMPPHQIGHRVGQQ
jgi:RHS repeat-associated protein